MKRGGVVLTVRNQAFSLTKCGVSDFSRCQASSGTRWRPQFNHLFNSNVFST
jgi:hypothetical protein